jgi:pyruvyl transferase EpsO
VGRRQIRAAELRSELRSNLAEELEGTPSVGYLDIPLHRNVGDSLIFLGATAILYDLSIPVAQTSYQGAFDVDRYRALPSDSVMVFHGGGNFGDLWPQKHLCRLDELFQLRDRRCLFLPQSLWFEDVSAVAQTRSILRQAASLTMMWSDRRSFEQALTLFDSDKTPRVAMWRANPTRAPSDRASGRR